MRKAPTKIACTLVIVLLGGFGLSHAGTIVSNLGQPVDGHGTVYGSGPPQAYAQEFNTGSFSGFLGSVVADVGDANQPFTASAELLNDHNNSPGSTVLGTFSVPTIGTAYADLTFTATSPVALSANTNYWFVLSATGTGFFKWAYTANETDGITNYAYSHNNGLTWTVESNGPFLIAANSVPEPSSLILCALGMPAVVMALRHGRASIAGARS